MLGHWESTPDLDESSVTPVPNAPEDDPLTAESRTPALL